MTESADVLRDDELLMQRTFDAPDVPAARVFRLGGQRRHHVRPAFTQLPPPCTARLSICPVATLAMLMADP